MARIVDVALDARGDPPVVTDVDVDERDLARDRRHRRRPGQLERLIAAMRIPVPGKSSAVIPRAASENPATSAPVADSVTTPPGANGGYGSDTVV